MAHQSQLIPAHHWMPFKDERSTAFKFSLTLYHCIDCVGVFPRLENCTNFNVAFWHHLRLLLSLLFALNFRRWDIYIFEMYRKWHCNVRLTACTFLQTQLKCYSNQFYLMLHNKNYVKNKCAAGVVTRVSMDTETHRNHITNSTTKNGYNNECTEYQLETVLSNMYLNMKCFSPTTAGI